MDSLFILSVSALCAALVLYAVRSVRGSSVHRETKQNKCSVMWDAHPPQHSTDRATGFMRRGNTTTDAGTQNKAAAQHSADAIDTALALEILAAQLSTGLSLEQSLEALADALPTPPNVQGELSTAVRLHTICAALNLGAHWNSAWAQHLTDPLLGQLGRILAPGYASGTPSATLLRHQADAHRTAARRGAERAAAKLSVALVLPLGLCSLPAFVCLSIVPIVVSLLPTITG